METPRKVVLCADDYGLSPGVSRGIRELLEAERLSATGCMTVYPEFAEDGPLLRPFLKRADIGLHFTLTSDRPLSSVLLAGWLRRLDANEIRAALERQIETFVSVMGTAPAFIDGHQHVHLLPRVREAVIEACARLGAYVRLTREPVKMAMLKRPAPRDSAYLSWSSRPLERLAGARGVRTNRGFRGVRSFRERAPIRDLFRAMIAAPANGSIIMCHPGHVDALLRVRDPIHAQREAELAYFLSPAFAHDLAAAGAELSTLGEALS